MDDHWNDPPRTRSAHGWTDDHEPTEVFDLEIDRLMFGVGSRTFSKDSRIARALLLALNQAITTAAGQHDPPMNVQRIDVPAATYWLSPVDGSARRETP